MLIKYLLTKRSSLKFYKKLLRNRLAFVAI